MSKASSSFRVGVLSTLDAPLLPHLLQTLFEFEVKGVCVLLDEKGFSEKDLLIWQQRTEGAFDVGPSLYDFASNGLALYPVKNHNSEIAIELIRHLGLSLLVNGGTPRKLNRNVLHSVAQGVINVHPGVLPKYRGSSCVEWAIYNDDKVGNTAHFMTEGYDEGPIINTESYDFSVLDTYVSIRTRVYRESLRLMAESIKKTLSLSLSPKDASQQGAGEFFRPITHSKMQLVLEKISSHSYRYMKP